MRHTYLFKEGKWIAKGSYYDEKCRIVQVEGQTIITHNDETWINDGYMKLLLDNPVELFNKYEITPFSSDSDMTSWKSYNPALGELKGNFMIVEDSIMSKYTSEDGQYSGYEYLKKIDDFTYENRGFAIKNDTKLSSWSVQLKRTESVK